VVAVIERLRAEGKTIFIITHDYELLLAACTRALILEDGSITSDFPLTEASVKEFSDTYAPVGDGVLDVPLSALDVPLSALDVPLS
jgi:energy-coupling factor transport system ATP-binding protein